MTVPVLRQARHSHSGNRRSFLIPLMSPLVSVSGMRSVAHIGHNLKIFTISLTFDNIGLHAKMSPCLNFWTMARLQKKKTDSGHVILQEKMV